MLNNIFKYLLISLTMILISCSGFQQSSKVPPTMKSLSFDYTPPSEGYAKYSGITFAIINPKYVSSFTESNSTLFKTFAGNMGKDFAEMLTARGFQYKGPFGKIDELVYNEKKLSDLVLSPEMEITLVGQHLKYGRFYSVKNLGYVTEYYYDGDITMTAKLTIELSEPFTGTKIWVKSLQIDPITFKIKSYYSYPNENIPVSDPLVWNSLVDNLNKTYVDFLTTSWNHLDPEELMRKKDEANEIKQNSGFLKN